MRLRPNQRQPRGRGRRLVAVVGAHAHGCERDEPRERSKQVCGGPHPALRDVANQDNGRHRREPFRPRVHHSRNHRTENTRDHRTMTAVTDSKTMSDHDMVSCPFQETGQVSTVSGEIAVTARHRVNANLLVREHLDHANRPWRSCAAGPVEEGASGFGVPQNVVPRQKFFVRCHTSNATGSSPERQVRNYPQPARLFDAILVNGAWFGHSPALGKNSARLMFPTAETSNTTGS